MPITHSTKRACLLFGGQGIQRLQMFKQLTDRMSLNVDAYENKARAKVRVAEMHETSKRILGYDLQHIADNGTLEDLQKTSVNQPATLLAGLLALETLKVNIPEIIANSQATAGLSIGEITSLVFAEALTFEDALKIVKVRAEAMQKAAEMNPGGMTSVVGCNQESVDKMVAKISNDTHKLLKVGNYLSGKQWSLSGEIPALERAEKEARKIYGAKLAKRIPVSGAFHTEFMRDAVAPFEKVLAQVNISEPRLEVLCNVTGKPYAAEDGKSVGDVIRAGLLRAITEPAQWETCMKHFLENTGLEYYELGGGNSLSNVLRTIAKETSKTDVNIYMPFV